MSRETWRAALVGAGIALACVAGFVVLAVLGVLPTSSQKVATGLTLQERRDRRQVGDQ